MEPRPYQKEVLEKIFEEFKKFRKLLVVLPTGGGKTLVFSWCADRVAKEGGKTLILAHREELVEQAIKKLHAATGIVAGKEKAEFHASLNDSVVVGSIQSVARRLEKWPANHFQLVVADEAHHALAVEWATVLNHFTAKVLGVTATPDRGDKRNLGQFFESVAAEVSLFDLIHQGYLSRIVIKSIPLQIDLSNVRTVAGDYSDKDLGTALLPYLGQIAQHISDEAAFRRTLAFWPLIATSQAFVEKCRSIGLNAVHIDGKSEDRKEILERYDNGEIDVLSNAMLLLEGYDSPGIDCVAFLRPTQSRALYSQAIGRGTRTAPAKKDLLLLDFLWQHEKHKLIKPAHLVAHRDEEAAAIALLAQEKPNEELDLEGLANSVREERERKLREELEARRNRKARTIDAMDLCISLGALEVAEYEPEMKWETEAMTLKQAAQLSNWGINTESVKNKGHASKLLGMIYSRRKLDLASPKQVNLLRKMGHERPEEVKKAEASAFIDRRSFLKREPEKV